MLFDAFVDSVHWFRMLFHEPFLRSELATILQTGRAYRRQKSLLHLLMVVLANGSRYLPEIASQQVLSEADLKALQSDLMNKLEASVGSLRVRRVCVNALPSSRLGLLTSTDTAQSRSVPPVPFLKGTMRFVCRRI